MDAGQLPGLLTPGRSLAQDAPPPPHLPTGPVPAGGVEGRGGGGPVAHLAGLRGQSPWGQGGSELSVLAKAVENALARSPALAIPCYSAGTDRAGRAAAGPGQACPSSPCLFRSLVLPQGPQLMCPSLGLLSLWRPAGLRAEVSVSPRLEDPSPPRPAVPLLVFLGFCPVCSVFGPREGCGLAGALCRAWRQHPGLAGPPPGPLPTAPSQAESPVLLPG